MKKKYIIIPVICSCLMAATVLLLLRGIDVYSQNRADSFVQCNIGFATNEDSKMQFVSSKKLLEFEGKTEKYNGSTYYKLLSADDKVLYRAYLYAFENSFSCIYFPKELESKLSMQFKDTFQMLSLDSPLIEQNFYITTADFTCEVTNSFLYVFRKNAIMNGTRFIIDDFNDSSFELKMQALKRAQEITDKIPNKLSKLQKAHYLYSYITDNVTYINYTENTTPHYLFDALITGGSNCDGFANSISLLFNLAGIENYEVSFTGDGENEIGHTWNAFVINGRYYMLDATVDAGAPENKYELGFALTEDMFDNKPFLSEQLPSCDDPSLMLCDVFPKEGVTENELISIMLEGWRENGGEYVVAKICDRESYNLNRITQRFTNRVNVDTYSYYTETDNCLFVIYPQ